MKRYTIIISLFVGFLLLLASCHNPESPSLTNEFIIEPNHSIELVASEPLVILPVAMVEDSKNRLWVVEMPGYMRDIDGSNENIPDGRIVILSDTNNDGKIDSRKIFIDSLENPRALCLVNKGLLFTEGSQLKWTEIKGDTTDNIVVVDSFYVVGGNIEHQPNGLLYNIDNWIYSAKSNARYKFIKDKWVKEATSFRGQWGITMDESGRLIYNHNSTPLLGDATLPNQNLNNPYLSLKHTIGQPLTNDIKIYPIQATSVNRGYLPEVLDSLGKVINYTSACAPHLFYGTKLSPVFQKSAFVCAPEGNLIANYAYDQESQNAKRQLGTTEFLVSTDESFRPVNLHTGFDGTLYIVDMRKGIIQHSAYMSSYLRDNILNKGLDKINGKGRIYRVQSKHTPYTPKGLNDLNSNELISLLQDSNLQVRMYAQKELVSNNNIDTYDTLLDLTMHSNNAHVRIHCAWILEGMNQINAQNILSIAETTNDPEVLQNLIAINKNLDTEDINQKVFFEKAYQLKSRKIDLLLASIVGSTIGYEDLWFGIAGRYPNDLQIAESLASSCSNREANFLNKINDSNFIKLKEILNQTISNSSEGDIQSPQLILKPFDDDRTNGLKKYKAYCSSCHGIDGKGQKNVAPSLKKSSIIQGKESKIASIILNGYRSENSGYKIMMPAYKNDKKMTNQDIYDIISYLKSTFTKSWNTININEIESLRSNSIQDTIQQ